MKYNLIKLWKNIVNIQEKINNYRNVIQNLINKIIEEWESGNDFKNVDEKFIKK